MQRRGLSMTFRSMKLEAQTELRERLRLVATDPANKAAEDASLDNVVLTRIVAVAGVQNSPCSAQHRPSLVMPAD